MDSENQRTYPNTQLVKYICMTAYFSAPLSLSMSCDRSLIIPFNHIMLSYTLYTITLYCDQKRPLNLIPSRVNLDVRCYLVQSMISTLD